MLRLQEWILAPGPAQGNEAMYSTQAAVSERFLGIAAIIALVSGAIPARAEDLPLPMPPHLALPVVMARHDAKPGARSVAPPTIVSGKILTPSISVAVAPATPAMTFKFSAAGYFNYAYFFFTGPSGQMLNFGYGVAPPGAETAGTITFANAGSPLSIYTQPGIWKMTSAYIVDLAGNQTNYTQSQLAALFPSLTLTIANPNPVDLIAPVVSSGKIETPTISLSSATPFVKVALTATDNLSGIYSTYLSLTEPGGVAYPGNAFVIQPTQTKAQTAIAGALLSATGLPTGTWTISSYTICDVAQNCLTQSNAATLKQQLGATTFTVTK
jgi:hypothetical protein